MPVLRKPKHLGLIAFIFFVLTSHAPTFAAEDPMANTRLLSYDELISLPTAKRVEYLKGVRKMLVEVAAISTQTRNGLFANRLPEIRYHIALIDALLPRAKAQVDDISPDILSRLKDFSPQQSDSDFTCNSDYLTLEFRGDERYCELRDAYLECPKGFVPTRKSESDEGYLFCSTSASFAKLSPAAQQELDVTRPGKDITDILARNTPQKNGSSYFCGGAYLELGKVGGSVYCRLQKTYSTCPDGFTAVDKQSNGTSYCATNKSFDQLNGPQQKEIKVVTEPKEGQASAPPPPPRDQVPVATSANGGPPGSGASQTGPPPATDKPTGGGGCRFPTFSCEGRSGTAYQANKDICFNAGNISKFGSNKRCIGPKEFKLPGDKTIACKDSEEIICNPLIFGVRSVAGEEAICIPRSQTATRDCDAAAKKEERRGSYEADFVAKNFNGLKEQWGEIEKGYNQLCFTESSKYYCVECGVMAKRLHKLNAVATGDKCGQATTPGGGGPKDQAPPKPAGATTAT